MPNVEVRDADGNLLQTYEIIVDEIGPLIKEEYLFDIAKLNAVEDELIAESKADQLTFKIAD